MKELSQIPAEGLARGLMRKMRTHTWPLCTRTDRTCFPPLFGFHTHSQSAHPGGGQRRRTPTQLQGEEVVFLLLTDAAPPQPLSGVLICTSNPVSCPLPVLQTPTCSASVGGMDGASSAYDNQTSPETERPRQVDGVNTLG